MEISKICFEPVANLCPDKRLSDIYMMNGYHG